MATSKSITIDYLKSVKRDLIGKLERQREITIINYFADITEKEIDALNITIRVVEESEVE